MTIPPLQGSGTGIPPFRIPVLTAPVASGVPPLVGDPSRSPVPQPGGPVSGSTVPGLRDDAPIALAGRLETGQALPDTTQLAMALESATRGLQRGRPDLVLSELDLVWSDQLASDSPWYLRTAALQLLGRADDAEQVLRMAIDRLPRSAAMLYLLGVHTTDRGLPDAARLANDHALALHPSEPLLWLQRAALARTSGRPETADAMLAHILTLDPAFPADQWFAALLRLGGSRSKADGLQDADRTMLRLTPGVVMTVADDVPADAAPERVDDRSDVTVLGTAVRYGLTLLESPTQSARAATNGGSVPPASSATATPSYGTPLATPAPSRPTRATLPWQIAALAACGIVAVAIPSLRLPALMASGVAVLSLLARQLD